MSALPLLLLYCALIIAASITGGRLSSLLRMTHLRTQLLMSAVGGLMLGIALLHLMPHGQAILGSASKTGAGVLAGLIAMFLMIRLFHTHDHGVPVETDAGEHCDHSHGHDHNHDHVKGLSWFGLFFGLVLHTLVDGVALASSVLVDAEHGAWMGLAGLGTFLAVALHKPLDAFAITSVMGKQNWSPSAQRAANIGFSLACPIGALAFYFGSTQWLADGNLLGWGLVVSAGFFIGIALADLLPEVAFHDHDRVKLTTALLLGIGIAIGIENLPGHSHDHSGPQHKAASNGQADSHDGHSHEGHDHDDHDHDH